MTEKQPESTLPAPARRLPAQQSSHTDAPPGQQDTPRWDGVREDPYEMPVHDPSGLGGEGGTGREGMERTGHTAREGVRSLRDTGRANLPESGVEGNTAAEERRGHEDLAQRTTDEHDGQQPGGDD